ncbi:MAG: methyltransferase domain-containing protein [Chloroflexota bacterium]
MSETGVLDLHALHSNDLQLEHLFMVAQEEGDQVRSACSRAGIVPGARVIDIGCGPLGALLELTDIVGPEGTVVGLDTSAEFLETARQILAVRGLEDRVPLIQADINSMNVEDLSALRPFDAAYLRNVLFHQEDPAQTLRQAASILSPHGWVLAQELIDDARYPWFDPPVPEAEKAMAMFFAALGAWGRSPDVARRMPAVCAEAGLVIVEQRGSMHMERSPGLALKIAWNVLSLVRGGFVELGLTSNEEVEEMLAAIDAAQHKEFHGYLPYLTMQTIARVA